MMKKIYTGVVCSIVLCVMTVLFAAGRKILPNGWYYIPEFSSVMTGIFCVLWLVFIVVLLYIGYKKLVQSTNKIPKFVIGVIGVFIGIVLSGVVLSGSFLFILKYDEHKLEQYDKHIVLYEDNNFVRVENRRLYYRYHENFMLMRMLTDEENEMSINKYGNPNEYYEKIN